MSNAEQCITGNETVDLLRGVQLTARHIADVDNRIAKVQSTLNFIGAERLIGRELLVRCAWALAHEQDQAQNDHLLVYQPMLFAGQLDEFAYVVDEDVPIDSLTLDFTQPTLIDACQDGLKRIRLKVPILAITECITIEAA